MRTAVVLLALVAAGGDIRSTLSARAGPPPSARIRELEYGATPERRIAAIRSGADRFWSSLTDAVRDPDVRVCKAAFEADLGRFKYATSRGDREGCLVLLEVAHDADPGLRLAALRRLDTGVGALPVALPLARAKSGTDNPEQQIAAEWIRVRLEGLGRQGGS